MRTLPSLIADYLDTGEHEKQLSPDTIKAYRIDLRQFVDFTEGAWADKDMLDQYIKYLNQRFAPRSVKRKLASVRAFYHETEMSGELTENPFDRLHIRIHSPQQLPRIIPEQIVQALLQNAYLSLVYNIFLQISTHNINTLKAYSKKKGPQAYFGRNTLRAFLYRYPISHFSFR